jgi:hypothetical protein
VEGVLSAQCPVPSRVLSRRADRLCENTVTSHWQETGVDRNLVGTCVSHVRGRAIGTSLRPGKAFRTVCLRLMAHNRQRKAESHFHGPRLTATRSTLIAQGSLPAPHAQSFLAAGGRRPVALPKRQATIRLRIPPSHAMIRQSFDATSVMRTCCAIDGRPREPGVGATRRRASCGYHL